MAANALNDSQKLDPIVDVVRLLFWKRSQLRPIPCFAQKTLSSQSGAPRAGLLGTKMIFIKRGCEEPFADLLWRLWSKVALMRSWLMRGLCGLCKGRNCDRWADVLIYLRTNFPRSCCLGKGRNCDRWADVIASFLESFVVKPKPPRFGALHKVGRSVDFRFFLVVYGPC